MQLEKFENQDLINRLHKFKQAHVLQFWNELAPHQKGQLTKQLESFDFQLIESLTELASAQSPWEKLLGQPRFHQRLPLLNNRPSTRSINKPEQQERKLWRRAKLA